MTVHSSTLTTPQWKGRNVLDISTAYSRDRDFPKTLSIPFSRSLTQYTAHPSCELFHALGRAFLAAVRVSSIDEFMSLSLPCADTFSQHFVCFSRVVPPPPKPVWPRRRRPRGIYPSICRVGLWGSSKALKLHRMAAYPPPTSNRRSPPPRSAKGSTGNHGVAHASAHVKAGLPFDRESAP